jgi:hypothetical protein
MIATIGAMDALEGATAMPASPELAREEALRRCARLAARAHLDATRVERGLTPALTGAAADLRAAGVDCRLDGLEHCVKPLASLIRKARDDSLELGCDPDAAMQRVRDAIRYTVVIPTEQFSAGVERFRESLRERGVQVSSSFNKFCAGNRYMGVHDEATVDGQRFEIQFHTDESLAAKAWSRQRFELIRDPAAPAADRVRAYDECVAHNDDKVPIPAGVDRLGEARRTRRPAPLP